MGVEHDTGLVALQNYVQQHPTLPKNIGMYRKIKILPVCISHIHKQNIQISQISEGSYLNYLYLDHVKIKITDSQHCDYSFIHLYILVTFMM